MDINSYIRNTYDLVEYLDKDNEVMLVRGKIDGKQYVVKMIKAYDRDIYDILKESDFDGIPKIYEMYENEKYIYVIEEYIQGTTLDIFFSNADYSGNADWMIENVIVSICKILKNLHNNVPPIINRDIKPKNIIITDEGEVKLIDFNISRIFSGNSSKDTIAMGTPDYAAPEQFGLRESDVRSDIYGLGMTIKEIMKITNTESDKLNAFISKATELDPVNRFQNASEIIFFLKNYSKDTEYLIKDKEEIDREAYNYELDSHKMNIQKQATKTKSIIRILFIVGMLILCGYCFYLEYATGREIYLGVAILIFLYGCIFYFIIANNKSDKEDVMLQGKTGRKITLTQSVCAYKSKKYNLYTTELQRLGFSNIEAIPMMDLKLRDAFKYEFLVDSVTIDGKDDIKPGQQYDSNSIITILYHSCK
ncbi:MAG: protein kinase [Eubacterium sp.]|nr:protein kinase [Eubacterium sp.]